MYEYYNDQTTLATIETIKGKVDTINKFKDIRKTESISAQKDIIHAVSSIACDIINLLETLPPRSFASKSIEGFCDDWHNYKFVLQTAYDNRSNMLIEKAGDLEAYKCIEGIKTYLNHILVVIEKQQNFDRLDYEFDNSEK